MIEAAIRLFKLRGWPFWFQNIALLLAGIPAAIWVGEYTSRNPGLLLQLAIVILLLIPAFILASTQSTYLIPYILLIWLVGAEIRRLADWSLGQFSSINLLSVSPLIVSGMLVFALAKQRIVMEPKAIELLKAYFIPFAYAAVIGVLLNKAAGIYSTANYFIPVLVFIYLAVNPPTEEQKEKWIRIYVTMAVVLSIYGWYQYVTLPPWDRFWMTSVNMVSLGTPEEFGFRIFSTLNSTGPLAVFLVSALIPAIVNKKWRGPFGLIGIPIMVSALALTLVRASWITLIAGVVAYFMFGSNANRWRMLAAVAILTVIGFIAFPLLPGGAEVTDRVSTLGSLESDQSANSRWGLLLYAIPEVLSHPFGTGFGSIGRSTALNGGEAFAGLGSIDNGYLGVFAAFGIFGGILYFRATWMQWSYTLNVDKRNPYRTLGIVNMVQLAVGFLFGGALFSLNAIIFWLFSGLIFTKTQNKDK
ncbi:O-antigen ligase family protein [Cohnella faecalis]|nr:O-antigen ligase family protein [Cohnella faecalis]